MGPARPHLAHLMRSAPSLPIRSPKMIAPSQDTRGPARLTPRGPQLIVQNVCVCRFRAIKCERNLAPIEAKVDGDYLPPPTPPPPLLLPDKKPPLPLPPAGRPEKGLLEGRDGPVPMPPPP
jgi:hypothetical protein